MSVSIGSQLGPYEIVSVLGAGGMGEVYRARDTRLARDVALKLLPNVFTADPSRRARFEQEARAVAALNHPNIVSVYDVGDNYIVSELVDGELLRSLIAQGPVAARRTVEIGAQIADGLAAAHAAGFIHRDLKPENVMVTRDGRVKILDFGLARQVVSVGSPEATRTILATATQPGMILGTVAYMSPEQVRGQVADHRSDIFSLGIVLHEIISGSQPFRGDSSVEAMNAVLKDDAPELPASTPPALQLIVSRCLEKDPHRRFQSASDLAFALRSASSVSISSPAIGVATPRSRSRLAMPLALAVAALVLIAAIAAWFKPINEERGRVVRLVLPLPSGDQLIPGAVAAAPDGNRIVYIARRGGVSQLFLRSLDETEPRVLAGTEDATQPIFSYNGDSVVFLQQQKLKRLRLTGGSITEIANNQSPRGFAAMPDGGVVSIPPFDGSVKAYNDESRSEKTLAPAPKAGLLFHPHVLPGGDAILYTKENGTISVEIFARRMGGEEIGPIAKSGSLPHYANGYLLFRTGDGGISALPFDNRSLKATGKALKLARTGGEIGASAYDVAGDVLVYVTGETRYGSKQLISVDRSGTSRTMAALPAEFYTLSISPDGRRVALAGGGNESDIWTYDIERGVAMRVSFEQDEDETAVWSPDGARLAYAANRAGKRIIAMRAADGSGAEHVLCTTDGHSHVSSWSSDGKSIAFTVYKAATANDIWVVPADGSGKAQPFIVNPFSKTEAVFSPDGRWLAYTSNETGRREVYVTAFPGPGGRLQISNTGGAHPVWARNGRELYYRDRNHIMAVSIQAGAELKAGVPRPMFDAPDYVAFGVAPDGRFIALPVEESKNPATLNVVINWTGDLKRPEAEETK